MDLETIFPAGERQPGATDADLAGLERELGRSLPEEYRAVLRHTNGFNGYLAGDERHYLRLFDVAALAEDSYAEETMESFPDRLALGDTGASWFFALDLGEEGPRYRRLDMASDDMVELGTTFADLIRALRVGG